MIELLTAALLTTAAPQAQAAPQGQRIGQYMLTRYQDDCVLMRQYRMQGQVYHLWIDSNGRSASLQVLSPQWRDTANQSFTHRLSLNGVVVAEQMQGVRGPERTGGFAVGTDAAAMLELLPEVTTIRIDDANGALLWGGSTAGLGEAIAGLRDCVAGLGREL
ncbi:hypothetical protein GCM10009422_03470 [Brevundimonas kwangchunensis]|uniref:Uncharacterized protein n=1 Tax=Brevundimonas kwangchunensis TaxID=322163 RepID=A0ABN1GHY0_9CAUL